MPRSVSPHYPSNDVVIRPQGLVDDRMWATVGPILKDRGREELDQVLGDAVRRHGQALGSALPAQENESLRRLRRMALDVRSGAANEEDLKAHLAHLDGDTGFRVLSSLGLERPDDWSLDEIDAALAQAVLPVTRGRPQRTEAIEEAVIVLLGLYRRLTEKSATHNPTTTAGYDGGLHSEFDRFISATLGRVLPEVPTTSLSGVVRKVLKRERARG
jgi:hypothetical protein